VADGVDPQSGQSMLAASMWYLKRIERDLPELWPGAAQWTDKWGSCGSYPDARGYGSGVQRVRVPPEKLAEFWWRLATEYRELPPITVGPLETPGLTMWLAEHGYAAASRRRLMVLPHERLYSRTCSARHDVRVAASLDDLDQVLALDQLVFDDAPLTAEQRLVEWQRITTGLRRLVFVPGKAGSAQAAGLITKRTGWALLSGGETHPDFRRQGLYRAVTERRLDVARSWGADFVATEATPTTSEPILTRLGFLLVADITLYRPGPQRSAL
jgi:GNAT superfamily N-acetyltransferase